MEKQEYENYQKNIEYQSITPTNVAIALLIPPIIGFLIVFLITNLFELAAKELWPSLPVIWPEVLYYGGIFGGALGGIVAIAEIIMYHSHNRQLTPGKIFPPDLYYIGGIIFLTYALEFLSESQLLQVILFLLELLFFVVIGWNISKILLETNVLVKGNSTSSTMIQPKDENRTDSLEME